VPFDDESQIVVLVPSREEWRTEFVVLSERLAETLGGVAAAIDHVGSTAVPGLAAKDVIDAQVRVRSLDPAGVVGLERIGFRRRPEPWNREDRIGEERFAKAVFAPPVGERPVNVHVRLEGSPNARYALLFRDFLRADEAARRAWGGLKAAVAEVAPDLLSYGSVKAAALPLLMQSAERWAEATGWTPEAS